MSTNTQPSTAYSISITGSSALLSVLNLEGSTSVNPPWPTLPSSQLDLNDPYNS
jgi:hypothetical protein